MRLSLSLALLALGCSAPPALGPCGGASAPDALSLVAGGRASIPLDGTLAGRVTAVSGTGVEAVLAAQSVTVRAGYAPGPASITLSCADGALTVRATIEALRFEPLARWSAGPTAPAAREYFAWWMDPAGGRALYLYGGFVYEPVQFTPSTEMWRFDLTSLSWSAVTQTGTLPPPGGRVASDGMGGTYYFGGAVVAADGSLDTPPTLLDVVHHDASATWAEAPASSSAPGSYTGAFVYDAARSRWLSICGADARVAGVHCGVEAYTPAGGFVALDVAGPSPSGRYGFLYALDPETDRVLIFGGQTGPANSDIAGDTWALELAPDGDASHPRWTQLFAQSEGIAIRRNGAFALDPVAHRFVMWGGTPDGQNAVPGLDLLSLERGHEAWTHVQLPAEVPPRASGMGLYDEAGQRLVWGFGNSLAGVYTDLYVLPLAPSGDS